MHAEAAPEIFVAGPVLYARGADEAAFRLTALVVMADDRTPPELLPDEGAAVEARRIASYFDHHVWSYDFTLPAGRPAVYALAGRRFEVVTELAGDTRIAFVSCNGQENGDEDRDHEDRDVMWRRLLGEHRRAPFSLMLHGGDQLYADEAAQSHPDLKRWDEADDDAKVAIPVNDAMRESLRHFFFSRYLSILSQPAAAELYATVPSLMIWDDHDICDGWGSHPRGLQQSDVGKALFTVAREAFITFQLGAMEASLPSICLDPQGRSLTTAARFPGFCVALPDLRSERRPDRVMGEVGWEALTRAFEEMPDTDRRIVVSSVPTLGPRLSLVEALLDFYPKMNQYEDDLRDQWQSRAHRDEWRRWLSLLEGESVERGAPVTVVSGEIHLATRARMTLKNGEVLHQLVASGITHPEPPAKFARALGLLSHLGESPLKGRPIRICPLPGKTSRYTAERNYLVLERRGALWTGEWELERSGRTPALAI